MNPSDIQTAGDALYEAMVQRTTITPLSTQYPDITIDDAYEIQQRMTARRLAAGERIIGKKIGVTSKAVMNMLGVFQPDFGWLTDGMVYNEGQAIEASSLIQPKAEGEIAFVLKRTLKGPGITAADVMAATEGVMACFEIVDSRIQDWKIKIQDTVADNASCGVFLLGDAKGDPRKLDLQLAGMALQRNGALHSTSVGAAVQGSPINAVVWLANTLGRLGLPFRAGEIILSGSQSPLLPVVGGDELVCTIGGLGTCRAR
ncbi:MAG: 2-oxopent-4-enoate hydratase, partial [Pseudomonadota bacterium]